MAEAPVNTTPPPIQAPTAKETKYDRQLRLWAAAGQRALEESHVLLIVANSDGDESSSSSVAGSETLKNLVLPSIGSFTIADSAIVSKADLGINFFLEKESLGKLRAAETRKLLEELNPDVEGRSITQSIDDLALDPETSLKLYNLIIISGSPTTKQLRPICTFAQPKGAPVILLQSTGFYASFSIQLPYDFPIVDTHPDPDSTQDLRLLAPWPELEAEVPEEMDSLSDHDHGHIPYILVLMYFLRRWKTEKGRYPDTFKEKTAFRDLVRSGGRTSNPEGGEENFDEACAAVLKSISPPSVGAGCRAMFETSKCTNLTSSCQSFSLIASAIETFYKTHGVLPLPGSLPDMKAKSADYVRLQGIYKSKARKDVAEVAATVRKLEKELATSTTAPDAEIEAFCKNASHVKVLSGSRLPQLNFADPKAAKRLKDGLEEDFSLMPVLVALESTRLRGTGVTDNLSEEAQERLDAARAEVMRGGGGELHSVSSLLGGMAAQEAIKLITRQYVPVDNLCIYDGVQSKMEVLKL